jgi:hypothetical protein
MTSSLIMILRYRELGWIKESLEEMKRADVYAMLYDKPDEKEIIGSSLAHLEQEIENGDDCGLRKVFYFLFW